MLNSVNLITVLFSYMHSIIVNSKHAMKYLVDIGVWYMPSTLKYLSI